MAVGWTYGTGNRCPLGPKSSRIEITDRHVGYSSTRWMTDPVNGEDRPHPTIVTGDLCVRPTYKNGRPKGDNNMIVMMMLILK